MLAIFLLEEVKKGGLRAEIGGGGSINSNNTNTNNNSNNNINNISHNNSHNNPNTSSKFLPYLQILLPLSSSCFPINYTI